MRYALLLAALLPLTACLTDPNGCASATPTDPANQTIAPALQINLQTMQQTTHGVYYDDPIVGTGAALTKLGNVYVNYSAYLIDGTLVDYTSESPILVDLANNAAPGIGEGMIGMNVGGQRRLVVPSNLALGACGRGPIPPNSTMIYVIELVSIES